MVSGAMEQQVNTPDRKALQIFAAELAGQCVLLPECPLLVLCMHS